MARWGWTPAGAASTIGAMEREAVIAKWEEIERELVIGWCGASAVERRVEALRGLVAKQRASEGSEYELGFTGADRVAQILLLALCERYGLRAYSKKGRSRRSTMVVQGPRTFIEKVLAPMIERGLPVVYSGIDSWLHVMVEACILGDVPDRIEWSGGDDAGA